jgi:hypothetical protein
LRESAHRLGDRLPESFAYCLALGFTPPEKSPDVVASLEQRPQTLDQVFGCAALGIHLLDLEAAGGA